MGQGRSKHIGVGEAHAITKPSPRTESHHGVHTGHEGVAHHLMDWSNELFSRRVQEGDTLWHLSEKYLGDGNKWPYLQSACELDRDPHHLIPGRPITHHCINRAKEAARHQHVDHNPFHIGLGSHQETHHVGTTHVEHVTKPHTLRTNI